LGMQRCCKPTCSSVVDPKTRWLAGVLAASPPTTEKNQGQHKQPGPPQKPPRLAPGSLGLPVLGETLDYLKVQNTDDPEGFFREREARYGRVLSTNLLGRNTIVVLGPDAAELVLTNGEMH
jgi:hypothetical protein